MGSKKIIEVIREEKNGEGESAKRSKCWTFNFWVEKNNSHKTKTFAWYPRLLIKTSCGCKF